MGAASRQGYRYGYATVMSPRNDRPFCWKTELRYELLTGYTADRSPKRVCGWRNFWRST